MNDQIRDAALFTGVCFVLATIVVIAILILWKVDHDQDMEKLRLCYANVQQSERVADGIIVNQTPSCRSSFL